MAKWAWGREMWGLPGGCPHMSPRKALKSCLVCACFLESSLAMSIE